MLNQVPIESLPDGTVLRTTAYWNGVAVTHYGIMRREWNGQIVIDHNSKKIGHAATTDAATFADGSLMFIDSVPPTLGDGWQIAARARADVDRGILWTVDNNCEDMKSRALTGQSGSPTRDIFVGLGIFALLLVGISALSS